MVKYLEEVKYMMSRLSLKAQILSQKIKLMTGLKDLDRSDFNLVSEFRKFTWVIFFKLLCNMRNSSLGKQTDGICIQSNTREGTERLKL